MLFFKSTIIVSSCKNEMRTIVAYAVLKHNCTGEMPTLLITNQMFDNSGGQKRHVSLPCQFVIEHFVSCRFVQKQHTCTSIHRPITRCTVLSIGGRGGCLGPTSAGSPKNLAPKPANLRSLFLFLSEQADSIVEGTWTIAAVRGLHTALLLPYRLLR
jgi:hypothetical protein